MFEDEMFNPLEASGVEFGAGFSVHIEDGFVAVVGAKKLLAFSKEEIKLKLCGRKIATIVGESLEISEFGEKLLKIVGKVDSVCFEGKK